jgi:glycosyltransferase involved in cell wall biosynthesis
VTEADVVGMMREQSGPPTIVVHLITTLSQGGAERVLSQVVPRPAEHPGERHIVVSLVAGGMFCDELVAAGVEVRDLGMRPGRDVVRGTLRLAHILRELRPHLVISWMYHASLLDLLARPFAGSGRRAQMVWFLRGSLQAMSSQSTITRAIIRLLAWRSGRPDVIVANSRAGRDQHAAYGYRPRRWAAVPNGCDFERFAPDAADRAAIRDELGVTDGETLLAFIGRSHPEKGLDVLLLSLALLPAREQLTVLLIGEGTKELTLPRIENFRFVALGVRHDVERLLRGTDVLVLPSRSEGTANAVIEALATEVACIVTDVGDSRELVGGSGMTVPPGSPERLADAIARMIALDPDERRVLGALGRSRMRERHTLDIARAAYRALWADGS